MLMYGLRNYSLTCLHPLLFVILVNIYQRGTDDIDDRLCKRQLILTDILFLTFILLTLYC